MVDIQTFQNNVQALQSPDDNQRNQSEQFLNQFAQTEIENFTQCCLATITAEDLPNSLRKMVVIMMKKNLVLGKNRPSLFTEL